MEGSEAALTNWLDLERSRIQVDLADADFLDFCQTVKLHSTEISVMKKLTKNIIIEVQKHSRGLARRLELASAYVTYLVAVGMEEDVVFDFFDNVVRPQLPLRELISSNLNASIFTGTDDSPYSTVILHIWTSIMDLICSVTDVVKGMDRAKEVRSLLTLCETAKLKIINPLIAKSKLKTSISSEFEELRSFFRYHLPQKGDMSTNVISSALNRYLGLAKIEMNKTPLEKSFVELSRAFLRFSEYLWKVTFEEKADFEHLLVSKDKNQIETLDVLLQAVIRSLLCLGYEVNSWNILLTEHIHGSLNSIEKTFNHRLSQSDLKCSRCHMAIYKDQTEQKAAWKTHKIFCQQMSFAAFYSLILSFGIPWTSEPSTDLIDRFVRRFPEQDSHERAVPSQFILKR